MMLVIILFWEVINRIMIFFFYHSKDHSKYPNHCAYPIKNYRNFFRFFHISSPCDYRSVRYSDQEYTIHFWVLQSLLISPGLTQDLIKPLDPRSSTKKSSLIPFCMAILTYWAAWCHESLTHHFGVFLTLSDNKTNVTDKNSFLSPQ